MVKKLTLDEQDQQLAQEIQAMQAKRDEIKALRKEKGARIEDAEKQIEAIKTKAQDIVKSLSERKSAFQEAQTKDREALQALNDEISGIRKELKENGFVPPEMFFVKVNRKGQLVAVSKPGPKAEPEEPLAQPVQKKSGKKVAVPAQ